METDEHADQHFRDLAFHLISPYVILILLTFSSGVALGIRQTGGLSTHLLS